MPSLLIQQTIYPILADRHTDDAGGLFLKIQIAQRRVKAVSFQDVVSHRVELFYWRHGAGFILGSDGVQNILAVQRADGRPEKILVVHKNTIVFRGNKLLQLRLLRFRKKTP